MICENPIVEDDRVFILHFRHPIIIASVIDVSALPDEEVNDMLAAITIGARLEYAPESFLFSAEFVEQNSLDAIKLAGIMRRMSDWYKSYLIWEDSNN